MSIPMYVISQNLLVRSYIFYTLVANTGSDNLPQRTIQSLDVKAWGLIVQNGFNPLVFGLIPCLCNLISKDKFIQNLLTVQMYDLQVESAPIAIIGEESK